MGFKYKGKTGGKDAWVNYTVSSKGIKTSSSVKFGDDMTVNINKKRTRTTFNLGDGLTYEVDRYHNQPSTPAKTKPKYRRSGSFTQYSSDEELDAANRKFMQEEFWPTTFKVVALLFTIIVFTFGS